MLNKAETGKQPSHQTTGQGGEMSAGTSIKAQYRQMLVRVCFPGTTTKKEGELRGNQSNLVKSQGHKQLQLLPGDLMQIIGKYLSPSGDIKIYSKINIFR